MEFAPTHLEDLILVCLTTTGRPPDQKNLAKCLEPYFAARLRLLAGEWRSLVSETLEDLKRDGLIDAKARSLTQSGQDQVRQFLQLKEPPEQSTWKKLRNGRLIARALEIRPESEIQWKRLASAEGLRAAVLVRFYDLALDALPTLTEALNALAQQQSGEPQIGRLKPRIREQILRENLLAGRPGNLKVRLPAMAVGATGDTVESLRHAVINRWLDRADASRNNSTGCCDADLQIFARRMEQLARETESGRYGENKVFLSHLWKQYRRDLQAVGITRRQFDEQLLEANRKNLLALSRADLTIAMNPQDVEDSEIRAPYATFHFLKSDRPPT